MRCPSLRFSTCFIVSLLLGSSAYAQHQRFVYEVRDGVFESGIPYSAKLEQLDQSDDGTVMRLTYVSESKHLRSIVLFRGVCVFMKLHSKDTAELVRHGDDTDTILVQFPTALTATDLNDRKRIFVTQSICTMSQPVPK